MQDTMKKVVPDVTPMSSFSDLTKFLVYSFQESDHKVVEEILARREKALKDAMQKSKEILEKELKEEKAKVEKLMKSRLSFEEKVKKERDLAQKNLEVVVKNLRGELEKESRRGRDLRGKLSLASMEQKSLKREVEMLRECHKKKELESREIYEELKLERDSMKGKLALVSSEKGKLEDEMRIQREAYESKENLLQKSLTVESEKCSNLEKKLSLASVEKMKVDEDLRKTQNLDKELRKSQTHLEDRIRVLESKNLDLNKKLELYTENFCKMRDFAEAVIGDFESGNVRAKGVLSKCSDAGDVSMLYSQEKVSDVEGRLSESQISSVEPPSTRPLQAESKGQLGTSADILLGERSGGDNENNSKQDLKRRRSTRPRLLLTNVENS